jgi:hypothetical protein
MNSVFLRSYSEKKNFLPINYRKILTPNPTFLESTNTLRVYVKVSLMNIQVFSSSLLDALAFLEDFDRTLSHTRNWNSPHCLQNTFFCSMKHQNVILHHPSSMNLCGLDIHTILSSLYSKENLLGIMSSLVSVLSL